MFLSREKTLLPVKQNDGRWIYPTQVQADESEGYDTDEQEETHLESEIDVPPGKPETFVQVYASEQDKLKAVKKKVGAVCNAIIGHPEENTSSIKDLLAMLQKPVTKMIVAEKKIVCFSLLHVFNDILPGYKIRTAQETDKKLKLKKETKILLNYETSLLRYYKNYIDCLQTMITEMKGKTRVKCKTTVAKKKACQAIGIFATTCLCNLLMYRFHFNYYKNIISVVVPLACSKNNVVSNLCCTALEKLYKSDKLGEASLEAVKQTVKLVKERQFGVSLQLLRTFLFLRLQNVKIEQKSSKADMRKIRKQMCAMSRKEKKYNKKMKELEVQLRETEAEESKETKSKLQTEILNKVFWVYFHVLKDQNKQSLLTPVLEGLAKFSHLINLEFFDDLNSVLCVLMESGSLSDTEKLYCMQTVFTILSGQAESLNIDPQRLYSILYNIVLNCRNVENIEQFKAALNCFDLMLIKRKKKMTVNRSLAFIKRLSTASLQAPLHFSIATLATVRSLMINTKNSDLLLDTENSIGSGIYLPEMEDPEYSNACSTSLWELRLLLRYYHPVISSYAQHILNGCPFQGPLQLSDQFTKQKPQELLEEYFDKALGSNIEMAKCRRPAKRLCVRNENLQSIDVMDVDFPLMWNDVVDVNFNQ